MKRPSPKVLYLATTSLVMLLAAPILSWAAGGALHVHSSTSIGTVVLVKVANVGSTSESGLLSVTALVDGAPTTAVRSVTVEASSAAYAAVDFGGVVDIVIATQISEGGDPI